MSFRSGLKRVTNTSPSLIVENHTGVIFVNILFGLVVTQIAVETATLLANWRQDVEAMDGPRLSHLLVATTLTIGSFIGYHTSQNRPTFRIKFFNLPIGQFLLDVSMVFVYFLVVNTAERTVVVGPLSDQHEVVVRSSAFPELLLVTVAFVLYVLWDLVAWRIQESIEYQAKKKDSKPPGAPWLRARRVVSVVFTGLFGTGTIVVWLTDPTGRAVIGIDAAIIAALVLYRIAKAASPSDWGRELAAEVPVQDSGKLADTAIVGCDRPRVISSEHDPKSG